LSSSPKLIRIGEAFPGDQLLGLSFSNTHDRVLKYVRGAIAETDVPDALPEFIVQRRRWLNGSFFAATYAIAHVGQIMHSGHSFARKIVLLMETVYNIINLVFAWFSIVSCVALA
jgi:cellulose synthase/poly-beta-1,6-N-acetylglucosamine synthase-like glycosyltransferase